MSVTAVLATWMQAATTSSRLPVPAGFDLSGEMLLARLQGYGLQLLGALLILGVGLWLSRRLVNMMDRAFVRTNMEPTLRGFLRNVAYAGLLVVVVTSALLAAGVQQGALMTVLGAAGLAIGLALKDSLSNIASGVMLIMQRPFRVGDYVQVAGQEGTVDQVRIFQTRMRTADNRTLVMPNSLITTAPIVNFTANPRRRVDVPVALGYEDDLQASREALLTLAAANASVRADPAPEVVVTGFTDTRVNLELRAWVDTADHARVRSELHDAVRSQVLGSVARVPQRQVNVYHHDANGKPLSKAVKKAVVGQEERNGGDLP